MDRPAVPLRQLSAAIRRLLVASLTTASIQGSFSPGSAKVFLLVTTSTAMDQYREMVTVNVP